jgi:membrane protein
MKFVRLELKFDLKPDICAVAQRRLTSRTLFFPRINRTDLMRIKEFALRVSRRCSDDDVSGNAAKLGFYFLLSLFPLLIFLTSMIGFLPGVQDSLLDGLGRVVPPEAMTLVRDTLADVTRHRSGSVLSLGLIASLWSASSAVASLIDALNRAYGLADKTPFWKRRLKAIALTLVAALLVAAGSLLIIVGHRVGGWLEHALEISGALASISTILGYCIGFGLSLLGIQALYYFGPHKKGEHKRVNPGALIAAIGIVIGSLVFSFYVRVAPSASATYGSLGAVVTLMLWLYLVGLMLLLGGEINSELL